MVIKRWQLVVCRMDGGVAYFEDYGDVFEGDVLVASKARDEVEWILDICQSGGGPAVLVRLESNERIS